MIGLRKQGQTTTKGDRGSTKGHTIMIFKPSIEHQTMFQFLLASTLFQQLSRIEAELIKFPFGHVPGCSSRTLAVGHSLSILSNPSLPGPVCDDDAMQRTRINSFFFAYFAPLWKMRLTEAKLASRVFTALGLSHGMIGVRLLIDIFCFALSPHD
ncbi:unnamed protein product [Protopolystoma xenopodis]|uniref:Uncharacterized protein n=1 Tax=Protopolystoma xenopodis TaxID=117903 RepID=A0A448WFN1_9PLAT|nr:unnamed protein product [Protopolystoma xenopodis]